MQEAASGTAQPPRCACCIQRAAHTPFWPLRQSPCARAPPCGRSAAGCWRPSLSPPLLTHVHARAQGDFAGALDVLLLAESALRVVEADVLARTDNEALLLLDLCWAAYKAGDVRRLGVAKWVHPPPHPAPPASRTHLSSGLQRMLSAVLVGVKMLLRFVSGMGQPHAYACAPSHAVELKGRRRRLTCCVRARAHACRDKLERARRGLQAAHGVNMERLRSLHGAFKPETATCACQPSPAQRVCPFLSGPEGDGF